VSIPVVNFIKKAKKNLLIIKSILVFVILLS
jgi:hypothetical protein